MFQDIVNELHKLRPQDRILVEDAGGGIQVIEVHRPDGRMYVFGTANENWGADRYRNPYFFESGEPDGHLELPIISSYVYAPTVAKEIHRALFREDWHWFLVTFTRGEQIAQRGWLLARDPMEFVTYAQSLKLGVDIEAYKGRADMKAVMPEVLATD